MTFCLPATDDAVPCVSPTLHEEYVKRVLLVVRPAAGGIRSHVLSLIEWADPARVTFAVAAPADFHAFLPDGVPFFPLNIAPYWSPVNDLRAARRLVSVARDFDMVHAHGLRAGLVCALSSVPFLLTAHNLVERSLLTTLALRLIASRAVQVVAVSQAVADTLTACGVPPAKITVVPNGVKCDHFFPPPQRDTTVQRDAACIARLSPEKGMDILLDAAHLCPELRFTVAGDGPLRQQLTRAAPPNVTFVGRVPDTRPLLWASAVLIVPSRAEGQGIVALEAMAAGVPVVASRVGGLPEMVTDGETGLLFPAGDTAALAAALRCLQNSPALCEKLAENGLRLVREQFDVRRTVSAVVDVYENL